MEEPSQPTAKKIILSGITPTAGLTIGHYAGAIRNWVLLQNEYQCYFMIADLHAITVRQVPADLRRHTLDVAAMYIACGIDPAKCTLFIQSQVSAHAELTWVLSCFTGMGECSRMTQFKDKSGQHSENVNVGLFNYPVLMAADILLYQADLVPVGADQKQHLELARNLAERFNGSYSPTFTLPDPYIPKVGARIMSLQEPTKKMSKSDENEKATLFLNDDDEVVRNKIRRSVTDSGSGIVYDEENRPGISNLMTLHSLATDKSIDAVQAEFQQATYAEFKDSVATAVCDLIAPIREKYRQLRQGSSELNDLLKHGAEQAQRTAQRTLRKVYKKIGFAERT